MTYPIEKMRAFYRIAEGALERVRAAFAIDVKITLLIRVPGDTEGDIIISDDDLDGVIEMIERRKATEPSIRQGEPLTKLH